MNIVTILGNTNSGAGAIYEYLIGRDDTNDPFNKKEFRILSDPGGINDLYAIFNSYSLQSFNEAFRRLVEIEKLYRSNRTVIKDGLGLNSVDNYEELWNNYINSIKGSNYSHRYIYADIKKNSFIQILNRICSRLGYRQILFKNYLTGVSKREFRDHTYDFLTKLMINNNSEIKINVLNQCGTFSTPISSTELLGEPKIICVRRNPLDQYSELKLHKGMRNPKEFIDWYLHLKRMESRDQFKDEKVLEINFEDFVLNNDEEVKKISSFLKIDHKVKSTYKSQLSAQNIGKYKKNLTKNETKLIVNELSEWINIH